MVSLVKYSHILTENNHGGTGMKYFIMYGSLKGQERSNFDVFSVRNNTSEIATIVQNRTKTCPCPFAIKHDVHKVPPAYT